MTIIITGISDYGTKVKMRLAELNKTQKWLEDEISGRTGLYCDSSLLRRIFVGKAKSQHIVETINEILGIEV